MKSRLLTQQQILQIIELRQNYTIVEIAEMYFIHPCTVAEYLDYYKIKIPKNQDKLTPVSKQQENLIIQLSKIYNLYKVAEKMKMDERLVNRIYSENNLLKLPKTYQFSNNQINLIINLFNKQWSLQKIADQLNVSIDNIRCLLKNLKLNNPDKRKRNILPEIFKKCLTCNKNKILDNFINSSHCLTCQIYLDQKNIRNLEETIDQVNFQHYQQLQLREVFKQHRKEENRKLIELEDKKYEGLGQNYQIIRSKIASFYRYHLNHPHQTKNIICYQKYLGYNVNDLKRHIFSQFEDWMNCYNHGIYKKSTWKDQDPTTWTWQLDHIIPHADFFYTSVNDQQFKDCWALNNLRPYSAKQNQIDGITRIRHTNKNK